MSLQQSSGIVSGAARRLHLGLCSVTLRRLPADRVARLAADAGLACVEWGADVHAPPGDVATAEAVRGHTEQAGLRVSGYGSYFRAGDTDPGQIPAIVDTARRLRAPRIRIWAGTKGSAEATAADRAAVVDGGRRMADAAGEHGIEVAYEFHAGTLTDAAESALLLLHEMDRSNVATYWQPPNDAPDPTALDGLDRVLPQVVAVHAFSWWPGTERLRLAQRGPLWRAVAARLRAGGIRDLDLLLEFVVGDDPGLIAPEAASLRVLTAP